MDEYRSVGTTRERGGGGGGGEEEERRRRKVKFKFSQGLTP